MKKFTFLCLYFSDDELTYDIDEGNRISQFDTSLQPNDLAQHIADENPSSIICVAPGEGNKATDVIETESLAFPYHFPDGCNTYSTCRPKKMTLKQYLNARLLNGDDNRFASDPEYIFWAQYATELQQVFSSVSIASRKSSKHSNMTMDNILDDGKLKFMLKMDECYRSLTNIRGSPPYWEKVTKDLFAMLRQLGMPTFFITLSANDRDWIEFMESICKKQGKEVPENLDYNSFYKLINSDIVTATRMFDKRLKDFITTFIRGPLQPLGKVIDWFGRIEFQARGWPHWHGMLWIEGAPIYGKSSIEEVVAFIDKHISAELPDPDEDPELYDLVSKLQRHKHTKTCTKGGKEECRFNFPKPPCDSTFIAAPFNKEEKADQKGMSTEKALLLLKRFYNQMIKEEMEGKDVKDILKQADITQTDLEEAFSILSQKPTVYHKRKQSDCWINVYNPFLLKAWKGNMDIQYILDPYSCIMYICSYITKAEKELGQLIKQAQEEARSGNVEAITELRKIGQAYLTHREISVMEAVYRALGLHLKQCSREVVWIPSDPDATRITLPIQKIRQNAKTGSKKIWMTSIIDRYLARPQTETFDQMCLAQFASAYKACYKSSNNNDNDDDDNVDDENENSSKIKLQHDLGYMIKRGNPAVIRYPKFNEQKHPDKFYFNLLKLYVPHRKSNFLPGIYLSYREYYENGVFKKNNEEIRIKTYVQNNIDQFQKIKEDLEAAWEKMDNEPLKDAWASIAPSTEQQRCDDEDEKVISDDCEPLSPEDLELFSCGENIKRPVNSDKNFSDQPQDGRLFATIPDPKTKSDEEILQINRSLNFEQTQLFNYIKMECLLQVNNEKTEPFNIFLTGGAGSGKSRLIHSIYHMVSKMFARIRDNAEEVTVLKVAYTGRAAINIAGKTIHAALLLPVKLPKCYIPLPEKEVNTLRLKYSKLKVLIIDEISMVSKEILTYISGRLSQIKGINKPFGGVSVLCSGDFHQLPPVFGTLLTNIDLGALPQDLWTLFKKHSLTKIMRQKDDLAFAEALNHVRSRKRNDPLDKKVDTLLKSRVFAEANCPQNAVHLYATNSQVKKHNETKLKHLGSTISSLVAVDIIQDGRGKIFRRKTPVKDLQASMQGQVDIAVGARIMLTVNMDTDDGLVNGAFGTVVHISEKKDKHDFPESITVEFDDPEVGRNYKQSHRSDISDKFVKFCPHTIKVPFKNGHITRKQYPFKLAWACTIHKVQGMTFDQIVISLKKIFKAGMAYVALSRVTTLQGLFLLDYNPKTLYCSPDVTKALLNMQKLDLRDNTQQIVETNDFTIINHNVQSLAKHFPDLRKSIEHYLPDVYFVTETWLSKDDRTDMYSCKPEYNCEFSNSIQQHGAGVAMYIKEGIQYDVVVKEANSQYDMLSVLLKDLKVLLAVVYRHCNSSIHAVDHLPDYLIKKSKTTTAELNGIIIGGDFNDATMVIEKQYESKNYQQVIKDFTTMAGTSIDCIFLQGITPTNSGVLCSYFSHHLPVYATFKLGNIPQGKKTQKQTPLPKCNKQTTVDTTTNLIATPQTVKHTTGKNQVQATKKTT